MCKHATYLRDIDDLVGYEPAPPEEDPMAHPTTRRWAAVAAAAAALLAVTACGGGDPAPNAGDSPTGDGQLGGAVSATADPSATATNGGSPGGGGGGGGGTPAAPSYPKDAKTYGLEILKAWGSKDYTRFGNLADANTVNQAKSYGDRDTSWTYVFCQVSGAQTDCKYYNATGDIVQISMRTNQLGSAGAGTLFYMYYGSIPNNTGDYVGRFIYAWNNGDYAAMVLYSSTAVADHFTSEAKFPVGTQVQNPKPCASNTSKTCVDVIAVPPGSAKTQHFVIDSSKIAQKSPNGITGYELATAV